MLVLSRGPEEAIMIGSEVEVRVLEVRGDRVRLGIVAPDSVAVHRKEVFLSIQRENLAATASEVAGLANAVQLLGAQPADTERDSRRGSEAAGKGASVQARGEPRVGVPSVAARQRGKAVK